MLRQLTTSIIQNTPDFKPGCDSLIFVNEIDNYIKLKFKSRTQKVHREVAKQLNAPLREISKALLKLYKQREKQYKYIIK